MLFEVFYRNGSLRDSATNHCQGHRRYEESEREEKQTWLKATIKKPHIYPSHLLTIKTGNLPPAPYLSLANHGSKAVAF